MSFILIGILSSAAQSGIIPGVAGYFGGGQFVTVVDKFAFPSDTRTTLATGLSQAPRSSGAMANSLVAGYVAFGTAVDKFAFPSDSRSSLGTGLSSDRDQSAGFADTGTAGYIAGGTDGTIRETVDKFAFPSDTRSTLATGMSQGKTVAHGFANARTAGYVAGGATDPPFTSSAVIDKFALPSETRTTLASGLSAPAKFVTAYANAGVAGYAGGGELGSTINKFAFPSDTRSIFASALTTAGSVRGMSNSGIAGYVGLNNSTNVGKWDFATDTSANLSVGLSTSRVFGSAFANEGGI